MSGDNPNDVAKSVAEHLLADANTMAFIACEDSAAREELSAQLSERGVSFGARGRDLLRGKISLPNGGQSGVVLTIKA